MLRPVCIDPEQRPILKVRVVGLPCVLIHPMARLIDSAVEINVICQVLGVVRRGYEAEDWNPMETPIQAAICYEKIKEVPPVGSEVEAIVFDDWYNWVVPEKRVVRIVITRYPQ